MSTNQTRRNFLKIGGVAVAMIPLTALAAKNDAIRAAMKYEEPGKDPAKHCSTCAQFVPGKSPTDRGGCTVFPNDTEISPNGSCVAWAKKP